MVKKSKSLSELDKKLSADVLQEARVKTEDMLFDLRLAEVRELTQLSQVQLAETMGVKQPTLSRLEKKGNDVRLKTLKRYVEAAGCKLRINIEMPDGTSHGLPI